ncbi:MAG: hypothetical protein AAGG01_00890 [Planctomycetota bacterium]
MKVPPTQPLFSRSIPFLAAAVLTAAADAQIVWTGAAGEGIFREANWDFSGSTLTEVDSTIPIADHVQFIGPATEPRIPELAGQEAFTVADGYTVLIDNIRVFAAGNDGIGGEPGAITGMTVNVVHGGILNPYFIRNRTTVNVDGTSQLIFNDPANPVNGSTINLTLGAHLEFRLEDPDEFRNEHLSKVTVDGVAAEENINIRIDPVGVQGCLITVLETDVGTSYCQANANTTGMVARMSAFGSGSIGANQLSLTATQMPRLVFGFFIVSETEGFATNPGGSAGNLCVSGSVGRFVAPGEVQNSGLDGTIDLSIDLMAIPQPNGPVTPTAGSTWRFQCWFRDAGSGGMPTSNFTDGLAITLS